MPRRKNPKGKRKGKAPQRARGKPRQARPPRPPHRSSQELTPLASCMRDYAAATLNPAEAPPTCLPAPPTLPSGKLKVWSKGTMTIGTNGVGFVVANPTLSSGDFAAAYSNLAFTGTSIEASGVGVASTLNNSPYLAADFGGTGIQSRHVATGLRIRYTGTLLNRGGRALAIEAPSHTTVIGMGADDLLAFPQVRSAPIGEEWINEVWNVRLPSEYQFVSSPAPGGIATWSLGILVNGSPGNTFEFEVYTLGEVVGTMVTNATESHGDSSLFSRLVGITGQLSTAALDRYASLPWSKLSKVALNYVVKAADEGNVFRRSPLRLEL